MLGLLGLNVGSVGTFVVGWPTALDERAKDEAARTLHANLWRSLATLHANLWRPLATLQYVLQGAVTCGELRSKIGPLTSNNNRVSASSQPRSSSALLFDFPPSTP